MSSVLPPDDRRRIIVQPTSSITAAIRIHADYPRGQVSGPRLAAAVRCASTSRTVQLLQSDGICQSCHKEVGDGPVRRRSRIGNRRQHDSTLDVRRVDGDQLPVE
jgi:hypothetical protein